MNHSETKKKAPASRLIPEPRSAFINQCQRCGTCCQKGGPALHKEDAPLIEQGAILTKNLFTLRKGEMAVDNVRGYAAPLEAEIIKIKGQGRSWACCFYDPIAHTCGIYDARPVECRVLACWNTADIERMYAKDRLKRQDLLGTISGLWEVVQAHEQRCAYRDIEKLAARLKEGAHTDARAELNEMVAYDRHLRSLTVEKSGIDPAMLDFLFGRPLSETLPGYSFLPPPPVRPL
ncbi:MAG: YkgJ family cysteine cluster protein [Deltaproteobacteria bacterium]|nr:MAG: YkgJ family cysteine cluster protein [Deltaproteobacteria bacterium]